MWIALRQYFVSSAGVGGVGKNPIKMQHTDCISEVETEVMVPKLTFVDAVAW